MPTRLRLAAWLCLLLVTACPADDKRSPNLVEVWNKFLHQSERALDTMLHPNETAEKCVKCGGEGVKATEEAAARARLSELRVQYVQNQILRKLRMHERPPPGLLQDQELPSPVAAGATMLHSSPSDESFKDDFYGKMDQKVIFPEQDGFGGYCEAGALRHPTACFSFQMPQDLTPKDVSTAELWVYKEPDPLDGLKQTLVISEAAHWDTDHFHKKMRPVAIHETNIDEGWMKVDVGWALSAWLEAEERVSLAVSCRTCGAPPSSRPVALKAAKRPFLVINTRHNSKKRRPRQLECAAGISECCREPMYVKFSDIGWDDWIVWPRGYNAYFCKGSCSSVAAVTLSASHHNTIMKKLFHSKSPRRLELKPCCSPTTFSSLPLLFRDLNNSATEKLLPNMVVESCGCM